VKGLDKESKFELFQKENKSMGGDSRVGKQPGRAISARFATIN